MIKLEVNFTSGVGGFSQDVLSYKQIARSDSAAIYERSRNGVIKDYEVIKIKITPKGHSIFNAPPSLDDEEMYPSTGAWGKFGWGFHGPDALNAAMKKYEALKTEIADDANEDVSVSSSIIIPIKEFTTKELAEQNHIEYAEAIKIINNAIDIGSVKFVKMERRNIKGKESKIYAKI